MSSSMLGGYAICIFQQINMAPFLFDLLHYILNNWSQVAAQLFKRQEDG